VATSYRDLTAQVEHSLTGDFHTVAGQHTPQFAAAGGDLASM
jgi:hypothetical protein